MIEAKRDGTKVVTGEVLLSFPALFEPKAMGNSSDKKYSAALLIPKSDTKTIKLINEAVQEAKEKGKIEKFGGKLPANLKLPLRDGDEEKPDDPIYAGHYFLNASSKTPPSVVNDQRLPIMEASEVYPGCYVRASVNFYAFNTNGNKGIAAGLNNIQKLRDGEQIGGKSRVEDDFEIIEDAGEDFLD